MAIIGEVSASLLPEVAEIYPDIPWAEMRAMRNIVIHEYFRVNLAIIWETINNDLPFLETKLKELV